jgi:DNA-binding CsgD family transcriptional regulator/sugar-specific transcriptional regulator TrmB
VWQATRHTELGGALRTDISKDLGLTTTEASVYRALAVLHDDADVAEVAAGCEPSVPVRRVTTALAALAERGLAVSDGDGWTALSPALPLGARLTERREALDRAELALHGLVDAYRSGTLARDRRDLVEVVDDVDLVRRRYVELQLSARRSLDFLATGGFQAVGPESTQEQRALERGVQVRGILDERFLSQPGGSGNAESVVVGGMTIRTVREIPLKMIISDDDVAMLPLRGAGTDVLPSVLLRGGLVNLARTLFDALWLRARPYTELAGGIAPEDARLLRLLLAGLTDAAVAHQLDLSGRTVQRRVQNLMTRAGVTTRLQLGWYARDHHWV